jgi:hypothetical protein
MIAINTHFPSNNRTKGFNLALACLCLLSAISLFAEKDECYMPVQQILYQKTADNVGIISITKIDLETKSIYHSKYLTDVAFTPSTLRNTKELLGICAKSKKLEELAVFNGTIFARAQPSDKWTVFNSSVKLVDGWIPESVESDLKVFSPINSFLVNVATSGMISQITATTLAGNVSEAEIMNGKLKRLISSNTEHKSDAIYNNIPIQTYYKIDTLGRLANFAARSNDGTYILLQDLTEIEHSELDWLNQLADIAQPDVMDWINKQRSPSKTSAFYKPEKAVLGINFVVLEGTWKIINVLPLSLADVAGIRNGDIILTICDSPVGTIKPDDVKDILSNHKSWNISITRDGKTFTKTIVPP